MLLFFYFNVKEIFKYVDKVKSTNGQEGINASLLV